jgi:hypothetical protein
MTCLRIARGGRENPIVEIRRLGDDKILSFRMGPQAALSIGGATAKRTHHGWGGRALTIAITAAISDLVEPPIVFGSIDAGVANPARDDGLTFLDAVWDEAPFGSHAELVATVERVAGEWEGSGLLSGGDRAAIHDAARRAEAELRA